MNPDRFDFAHQGRKLLSLCVAATQKWDDQKKKNEGSGLLE
jgi:hypothetical protein